jgi:pre-mRNA-splicing factor 18
LETDANNDKHPKRTGLDLKKFEDGCKKQSLEEKSRIVYAWCRKMLDVWQKDFEQARPENYLNTPNGKMELGTLQQCQRQIKPLFKLLKRNKLNVEILDSLFLIVQYCLLREYVKAHDKYVELGIGNSPWPMGVTMIGIHERSGRSRIFTSQQAHVLNDETQRKYL